MHYYFIVIRYTRGGKVIILKINNNRDFEALKAEGYFNAQYNSGDMESMEQSCPCIMDMCMPNMMGDMLPGVVCPPIYECPRQTIVNRYICHEVPHIIPCNTKIINHHIYRHTYTPTYSCCEENEVQNVYERRCL